MSKTQVLKGPKPAVKEIKLAGPLGRIDDLTEVYAGVYNALSAEMIELNTLMEALKAKRLPVLRELVADAKAAKAALSDAIAAVPEQFVKPRTRQLHGFKVGLRKLEGKIVFSDEEKSIKLIEKHFADQFDVLIATTQSIVKDAAAQLPAADLKRIGGEITDSIDEVVIKSATGDVEKLVDALIKEKADK